MPSNGAIAIVELHDRDLYFQGQTFPLGALTRKRFKTQPLLLPLDRKAYICHRMAHLRMFYIMTFIYIVKVTNLFLNVNIWKTEREREIANNVQDRLL